MIRVSHSIAATREYKFDDSLITRKELIELIELDEDIPCDHEAFIDSEIQFDTEESYLDDILITDKDGIISISVTKDED